MLCSWVRFLRKLSSSMLDNSTPKSSIHIKAHHTACIMRNTKKKNEKNNNGTSRKCLTKQKKKKKKNNNRWACANITYIYILCMRHINGATALSSHWQHFVESNVAGAEYEIAWSMPLLLPFHACYIYLFWGAFSYRWTKSVIFWC